MATNAADLVSRLPDLKIREMVQPTIAAWRMLFREHAAGERDVTSELQAALLAFGIMLRDHIDALDRGDRLSRSEVEDAALNAPEKPKTDGKELRTKESATREDAAVPSLQAATELEKLRRERDEYKTLAVIGVWRDDCRPNRHMAARELEKSQTVINKLADRITELEATKADQDVQIARLTSERDEALGKVALFRQQLSVQEERTGSWHVACDRAEAALTTLRSVVQQERERCAQIAEKTSDGDPAYPLSHETGELIAEEIRAMPDPLHRDGRQP